ncbi:hypothetical protein RJ640_005795 [Escallonia rubra]|uniref:Uncharacterized protein n=1 Tax=Escallonia rubra TaxID=112253 RepID=A0AA88R5F6_9ASTE|nr:hypothetical protein RJ640_005795 [Escallonia rubra]
MAIQNLILAVAIDHGLFGVAQFCGDTTLAACASGLNRSYIKDSDSSGSYRIPARALSITWGNDPRYWQWVTLGEDETQFCEGVMLQQVNWIEVTGKMDLSLFKKRVDAFGWHSAPIKFKVRVNGKEVFCHSTILEPYRVKPDVWQELPGGEFSVSNSIAGGNMEFGMFEVETDWWKGSMCEVVTSNATTAFTAGAAANGLTSIHFQMIPIFK